MKTKKLKKMHLSKKNKFKQIRKLPNRKKYYNLRIYLIKKIEKELLQKKLEIKNQQNFYKLLIFNIFLGFAIVLLVYLNFYKLALIGFGYLLIRNNSFIKETFDDYLIQKDRFNTPYKKKFPIIYYVLSLIIIFSGLEMFYTGYLLNNIYQDILFEKVRYFSCQSENSISPIAIHCIFYSLFLFCTYWYGSSTLYVIQKAK